MVSSLLDLPVAARPRQLHAPAITGAPAHRLVSRPLPLPAQRERIRRSWFGPWCLSRTRRVLDCVGAFVILVLIAPLGVIIAAAIRLDSPGPIFFRQWRTGVGGNRFLIWKFRTMRRDAEQLKDSVRSLSHHGPNSPDFKIKCDPRVTALGSVLRRWSLDELPNILNVLLGDMSLVGPRPTSFDIDKYEERHLARLAVPPGLTGLWQISGRSELDFDDRVVLDCRYIRDQSLLLDLSILLRTPFQVLRGRGAC